MEKKITLLFLLALLTAGSPVGAQVERQNEPTVLDATWTEVPRFSAESDGDLHLAGQSRVDYTVMDRTRKVESATWGYETTVKVMRYDGTVKASKTYRVDHQPHHSVTWEVKDGDNSWAPKGYGETTDDYLTVENGETGDYLYMEIVHEHYNGVRNVEVILTVLKSTTTRYDLYDDLPLFGSDTGVMPTSNRIKDHTQIIDVYVHRKIVGNGAWSTLCLPFDMTDEQIKKSLGTNVVYSKFSGVTPQYIDFTSTHEGMKAGKPYLIQNNGETIDNFFADDVTFTQSSVREANDNNRKSTTEDRGYYYVGLLEPTKVNEEDDTYNPNHRAVYVANPDADGQQRIKMLSANGKIKGFRAYLVFPTNWAFSKMANKMMINLDDMLSTPTSISRIQVDGQSVDNRIYNLRGQYVGTNADVLSHGIYVRNGKKFVVR